MPQGSSTVKTPRPVAQVALRLGAIPKELKKLDRWILWRYSLIEKTGKWTKTPHSAVSGHKVDATNFANGVDFTSAVAALKAGKGRFDGLGFLLGEGIAGIDVDDCIDSNGNLDERGQQLSDAYKGTYAEVSPSGQGFKILVNIGDDAKLAVIGKNTGDTEIYGSNRYFTVTGGILAGHAQVIAPMAEAFRDTAERMGAAKHKLADMPEDRPKEAIGLDLQQTRELLDHLPFVWCDSYSEWIKSGMALHHEFNGAPEALDLWDEWSQRNPQKYDPGACAGKWETFGRPGKDTVTLRTLVRDAQSTGWRAPHTIENAIRDFDPFREPDVPHIDEETGELSGPPDWWQQWQIGRMLAVAPAPKEWIWKGLLRKGKVMVLAGSGGTSKSYLMLAATIQYALGNNWGPFEIAEGQTPGRAMIMYGEEGDDDVHDRAFSLRHTFMLNEDQIDLIGSRVVVLPLRGTHVQLAKVSNTQTREIELTDQLIRLEKRIEQFKIELVVLDPLAMFHSLEENDNVSITALMAGLDAMCMRQGCSMVIVHHFGKTGLSKAVDVNESNVRGASSLVAHARTVAIMHRLREYEALEWGVPEDDHARWVMWSIVKNNYGPVGARTWFTVDSNTGAITPAPEQLQKVTPLNIRAAVDAARQEDAQTEFTEGEARKARAEAEAAIALRGRILAILTDARTNGRLCKLADAQTVLMAAGLPGITANMARSTLKHVKDNGLVDTDGLVNRETHNWLDAAELLG